MSEVNYFLNCMSKIEKACGLIKEELTVCDECGTRFVMGNGGQAINNDGNYCSKCRLMPDAQADFQEYKEEK